MTDERNRNGTFAKGNPGGPGRPRRVTELSYAKAVVDAVSVDDWKAVVQAAVKQAKEGDFKARDFLARHLIGEEPVPLSKIAALETFDPDGDKTLIQGVAELLRQDNRTVLFNGSNRGIARELVTGIREPDDDDDDDVDDEDFETVTGDLDERD